MAVVVKHVAAALTILIRRNITKAIVTSTRDMLSQTKVADSLDDMHVLHEDEEIEHRQVQLPNEEKFRIHINTVEGTLKVNLECVSNTMQRDLIEQFGPRLNALAGEDHLPIVRFNYLAEEFFINNLRMTYRKLGYKGSFTRYNHDKGIATFEMINHEDEEDTFLKRYSYYRSGQPNPC